MPVLSFRGKIGPSGKISIVFAKEGCRFFILSWAKQVQNCDPTKLGQNKAQKTHFCVPEHKHTFYSTCVIYNFGVT